jgi:hypothetical protein
MRNFRFLRPAAALLARLRSQPRRPATWRFLDTTSGAGAALRMEILEDKNQAVPIRNEYLHLFLPEAEIAAATQ